jgi:hypothetical protein
MSKISTVYDSNLPYQWEAGSYSLISHSGALDACPKEKVGPICVHCGHDKAKHAGGEGPCRKCSCEGFLVTALGNPRRRRVPTRSAKGKRSA